METWEKIIPLTPAFDQTLKRWFVGARFLYSFLYSSGHPMNCLRLTPLILALTFPVMTCSAANLYSWVDANGTPHFSDSPPPEGIKGTEAKMPRDKYTGRTDGSVGQDGNKKTGPALALAAGYTPEDIEGNCRTAKTNMSVLQARQYAQDANDTPVEQITANDLQAQIDKATQQLQLFCGETEEGTPEGE